MRKFMGARLFDIEIRRLFIAWIGIKFVNVGGDDCGRCGI